MSSQLAALICIFFVIYIFWTDAKKCDVYSNALWIPFFWIFLAGSRYFSSWLGFSPPVDNLTEGSPIDRAVFFSLIVAGAYILSRRKIDWQRLISQNIWIVLYFLYCFFSIAWSEEPFIIFKRWIKELGIPIMALVVLTDHRPYEAIVVILRRFSFLLLPVSVLFIKYYPIRRDIFIYIKVFHNISIIFIYIIGQLSKVRI